MKFRLMSIAMGLVALSASQALAGCGECGGCESGSPCGQEVVSTGSGCGAMVMGGGAGGACAPSYTTKTVYVPQYVTEKRIVTSTEYRTEQQVRTSTVYRRVPRTETKTQTNEADKIQFYQGLLNTTIMINKSSNHMAVSQSIVPHSAYSVRGMLCRY